MTTINNNTMELPNVSESLSDVLRDSSRPVFLFGAVPPRNGTSVEKAKEICSKFVARGSVLATDGFIIYDIQDEAGRTTVERPFPFRQCMDASQYASFFPAVSGKHCVVYQSVVEAGITEFDNWVDTACDKYNQNAFNLVGAPSSKINYSGLQLHEAGARMKSRTNCGFGCVCIPERHASKGNEHLNMSRKAEFGAEWFITQGVFSAAPVSKLINDYGDVCREKGVVPKKVVLTFAPCGRKKTMDFIKWLGMFVPEHKEKRILNAESPVKESVILLREILLCILQQTGNSGVPLGINVESLSIFKDEIDAAHDLFQLLQVSSCNNPAYSYFADTILVKRSISCLNLLSFNPILERFSQATLLNSQGSPWAVRWFPVAEAKIYRSAKASSETLRLLAANQESIDKDGKNILQRKNQMSDPDLTIHLLTIGFVGFLGVAIGRYSHQQ